MILLLACAEPSSQVQLLSGAPSPSLPDDLQEQAHRALERDAWRRENRFLEVVNPGRTWASTRLDEKQVAALDPADAYGVGGTMFEMNLAQAAGFAGKDSPDLRRFHLGERGGPDAIRCTDCHWRGGPAGGGDGADNVYLEGDGDTQASALERNPKALVGAGVVELLAREMTAELQGERDKLVAAANNEGKPLRTPLTAKGVSFGTLGVLPDGTLDTRALEGVDADLVVRPFGWKGTFATIPDVVENELAIHHGLQTAHYAETAGSARAGTFGGADPDGDGVTDEVSGGQLLALSLFVALQEVPTVELPVKPTQLLSWTAGEARFRELGCAGCHVQSLTLESTTYTATGPDGTIVSVDLAEHGGDPRLARDPADGTWRVFLFSDLKRHDIGESLAESRPYRGVPGNLFVTPPLWGSARSRPYLHNGSAPNIEDAILGHGGEAIAARNAYASLPVTDRYPVRIYLASLLRAARMVAP